MLPGSHPRLDAETHRILLKRIRRALEWAKYYPACVYGDDGPLKVATEVLSPYYFEEKENA